MNYLPSRYWALANLFSTRACFVYYLFVIVLSVIIVIFISVIFCYLSAVTALKFAVAIDGGLYDIIC